MIATVLVFGVTIDGYLRISNITNILLTGSVLGVMVIGQALCLMARKLDLSAEGTVSLVAGNGGLADDTLPRDRSGAGGRLGHRA